MCVRYALWCEILLGLLFIKHQAYRYQSMLANDCSPLSTIERYYNENRNCSTLNLRKLQSVFWDPSRQFGVAGRTNKITLHCICYLNVNAFYWHRISCWHESKTTVFLINSFNLLCFCREVPSKLLADIFQWFFYRLLGLLFGKHNECVSSQSFIVHDNSNNRKVINRKTSNILLRATSRSVA